MRFTKEKNFFLLSLPFLILFSLLIGCELMIVEPPHLTLEEDYDTPGGHPSDWGCGEPIFYGSRGIYEPPLPPRQATTEEKKKVRYSMTTIDKAAEDHTGSDKSLKLKHDRTKPCFAPDTLVLMADGSYKEIKEIVVGDSVLSYDSETDMALSSEIMEIAPSESQYHYVINGGIRATGEHPFYVAESNSFMKTVGGFTDKPVHFIMTVEEFTEETILYGDTDGNLDTLESIPLTHHERIDETITVYSIKAEPFGNYFVRDTEGTLYLVKCCFETLEAPSP
jgi:hypothetical protein